MKSLLLFLLVINFNPVVYAQNEPVPITISKEKVIIEGNTYYLHTIKSGETLYSISKAYGVPQKDITTINPYASTTLITGQILKIPAFISTPVPSSLNSENYIFHIVEVGQTIFSITEKYNISQEEFYKHNPETEISPIQVGQVVKIPQASNIEANTNNTKPNARLNETFIEHKVKKKETLYSISRIYQISVDDILQVNPVLNTSDIKTGQTLKIPAGNKPNVIVNIEVVKPDTNFVPLTKTFEPCTPHEDKQVHKVAFLLPLYLEENKTIINIDSIAGNKNIEDRLVFSRSKNLLEFYEGALLALDSLKKAGNSYKIYVYDTGRDIHKLTSILNRKELSEMELFIGPFDSSLLEKALIFAKENHIKVVSPLSQNTNLLKGNPNLYQVNPSETSKIDAAIQYLATQKDKNIILFKSNRLADKDIFNMFEEKLNILRASGFQFKTHIGNKDGTLSSKLVTDKDNLIVMPSNEETAVSDLLRNMNYINSSFRISIFGLPKWTNFSSTDISYLHNLQYEYYTSFYADYSKPVTKNFILKMHDYYKSEPDVQSFSSQGYSFAFLGYDITFYFLNALAKYGPNFESCLPNYQVDLIQSDFHFSPSENGNGTTNNVVNIIKYNKDYTITKIH